MNKKAEQADTLIKGAIGLIIIIPVLIALFGALGNIANQSKDAEIQKIVNEKDSLIQQATDNATKSQTEAIFYKLQYEALINTSITKKDISEIQAGILSIQTRMGNLENRTDKLGQTINNFYDIKNTYKTFTISIVVNVFIFIFFIFDITFFNFEITEALIKRARNLSNRVKDKIKSFFKWAWNKIHKPTPHQKDKQEVKKE